MAKVKSFFDLRTWQEAHALALEIYKATTKFPAEEKFGLISQLRSAAVSIPSNIAEGMGRASAKDLIRFLMNARGSTQEVIYQLFLSKELGYVAMQDYENMTKRYNGLAIGLNSHIETLKPYK